MRSLSGAPADPITLPIVACSPYSQGDPANFFSLSATNTENGWGTGKTPFHVQGWFDAATTGEQPDPYGMHTLPYFDQITLARPHTGATDDCHECGRLKLRCDRRSPCGACVKRGVTDRCKYPPNASEKMVTADCHECIRLKLRCDRHLPCAACVKRKVLGQCKYSPNASENFNDQAHTNTAQFCLHNQVLVPKEDRTRWQGHGLAAETVRPKESHHSIPPISVRTLAAKRSNSLKLGGTITISDNLRGGTTALEGTKAKAFSFHCHAKPLSDEGIQAAKESINAGQKSRMSMGRRDPDLIPDPMSEEFNPLKLSRQSDADLEDATMRMKRTDSFGESIGGLEIVTKVEEPANGIAETADDAREIDLSPRQICRNKVVEMLDKSLELQPAHDSWRYLRDHMKLCPFSVYYWRRFFHKQCTSPQSMHAVSFYSQAQEWMTWDLTKSLVRYRDIVGTILDMHKNLTINPLTKTALFQQWLTVLRAAMVNDVDDMCATLATVIQSEDRERLILLPLDELHSIMSMVQMFVDERCMWRVQFERFLKKTVRTRDILPSYLFIPGVQRIGKNAVGGGGFADVWKGELAGKIVALKVLRIFGPETECAKIFKEFSKEAMIWRQFDHPHILPFHGCCGDLFTPLYAFISPWMENGDMISFLKQNTHTDRLAMIRGVASGLCYLHNLQPQVVHGDLRGSNVLIDGNKLPRIADFGLARVADTQAVSLATVSYNGKGSLRWQAPELLSFTKDATECVKTTDGSDVYAFGCLCIEVFTDRPPFPGLSDGMVIAALLIRDERPSRPPAPAAQRGLDDNMWDLMQKCWATRRSDRPGIKAVYERIMPFTQWEERRDDREPFTSHVIRYIG